MKNLILTLLVSVSAFAQQGFRTEGQNLVWERTFSAHNADIVAFLNGQPDLKVTTFSENTFEGYSNQMQNRCNGGSALMKNDCKFDFTIMVQPDHYIVRITNLKILEKYGPMQARVVANACEKYFVDGKTVKTDARSQTDLRCLDTFLRSMFSAGSVGTSSGALTSN